MPFLPLGPAGDTFAGAFGATVALLLVGGPIALRWQRNRHQLVLAQAAIAKGMTRFPKGPPLWLLSLRQGIMALTLGVGLLIVGAAGCWFTSSIQPPATSIQPAAPNPTVAAPHGEPSPNVAEAPPPAPTRPGPPEPNLALEEWHRLKTINTLGLMSLATGFVLTLLGVVRIAFAATERHHFSDADHPE